MNNAVVKYSEIVEFALDIAKSDKLMQRVLFNCVRESIPEVRKYSGGSRRPFFCWRYISYKTDVLKASGIKISKDCKGRWVDNVMIERFLRSLKHEEVHLKAYESVNDARENFKEYIDFYISERKHQSLDKTPDQVYFGSIALPEAA